ncbi:MAG: hypothetical protein OXT09_34015 [Myxococcales bacterium]|nr:hypothetical protein [Myxococcales bacterium]
MRLDLQMRDYRDQLTGWALCVHLHADASVPCPITFGGKDP